MLTVACVLLTISLMIGAGCLFTGTFFIRSTVWLPLVGLACAITAVVADDAFGVLVFGVLGALLCGFLTTATWSAGKES